MAADALSTKNNTIRHDLARFGLDWKDPLTGVNGSWQVTWDDFPQKGASAVADETLAHKKGAVRPAATKGLEPRISRISRIQNAPSAPPSGKKSQQKETKETNPDSESGLSFASLASVPRNP